MNEKRRVCRVAVGKYGPEQQMDMLTEECAELIAARNHLRRSRINVADFLKKVADVEIMISQMRVIFGDGKIDSAINEKITRLAGKLGI